MDNNTLDFTDYIGMNFRKWAALDENDETPFEIELYFEDQLLILNSDQEISGRTMAMLQAAIIASFKIIDGRYYIKLSYNHALKGF